MATFFLNFLSVILSVLGFRGIRILAYVLGILAFDVLRIRRKIILGNLDIVFGTSITKCQKKKIGRKSVVNFITTALEFLGARKLLPRAKFEFENKHLIDAIISKNEAIYAICIHFGNWEYLCHINAKLFRPVHVVVKDVLRGNAEKWIKDLRKYIGYQLIDRTGTSSAAEQIFKAIDRKEVVGFIVDQKRSRGEMLPFFGRLASTNDSLAKLYFRKPAPISAAMITRIRPGHFKVKFFDQFVYEKDSSLSLKENISKFTLQVNQFIEPIILSKPEEYFWLHNRWNIRK